MLVEETRGKKNFKVEKESSKQKYPGGKLEIVDRRIPPGKSKAPGRAFFVI